MKKILVPIDFSLAAKAGFDSAVQLGINTETEIIALNIYQQVTNNYSPDVSLLLQQEMEKTRHESLKKFTSTYPNLNAEHIRTAPKIQNVIKCGNTVDAIINSADKYEVDLIVIGTKAKHNLWEYIFGSVSSKLIRKTKTPVLIVPEGTVYKNPQNIALANDFMEDELSYEFLDNFASIYNASVEQVHVNILPSDFSDLKEEVVEIDDGETHKSVTVIRDKSVKKGLDYFIETHNIDLLALHLPERTLAEDLLHRSVSKQIALSSKIPMLIFKG